MEENIESTPVSTRSVGLMYGVYAALISCVVFLLTSFLGYNPFGGGLNYIGTVASIVLMVLGHKKFKESGDGYMSFGQGFGICFWFVLISSAISLVVMYVYITFIDGNPLQLMLDENAAKMQESGQSDDQVQVAIEWTKKLFWPFAAFGAIFFGLIIGLIVTIFTQKKNPQGDFN